MVSGVVSFIKTKTSGVITDVRFIRLKLFRAGQQQVGLSVSGASGTPVGFSK